MKISLEKPERKSPVERKSEDGRIILKCNSKDNNYKPRPIHVALDIAVVTTIMNNCRLH
jgi:hypothetical protein